MVTEIIASDRDFLEEALSLAQGAAFFFVLHEEGIARDLQMQNLQQALEAQGRPVHKVRFDLASPDLLTMLSRLPLRPSTIVFVDVRGVEYAKFNPENYPEGVELRQKAQNARQMLSNLNVQRDQLTVPGVSLVFWVSEQALSQIAQWAADLFSARSGIFDLRPFVGPRPFISERSESMLYGSHLQELLRAVQELPPEERQKRKQTYERRLREESSKPVPHLARMASLHHELALLSLSLGETAKALSHQEAAVALYRKLAENGDPDALQISGKSLNEFGLILASLGQHEAALQATQEAVE
ncbi:MAG: tetratricopeptide repeat protein, partial [Chloroflexi bacterium]|nr:tetratricopeptide repeat protein [Chloroflexota bacterium]